jgi:ABC-type antimicrobial peptide transport system permease subunit
VALDSDPFFVVIARERTDPMLNSRVLREGRLIAGPRECLLGWKAANQHKKVLGDRLAMLGTTFRIVGIIETGSTFEDGGVIIGLRDAQQLLKKPHQVMMVQVKLHDPGETDAVLARLRAEYPKLIFSRSAEFTESLPDMQSMYASVNAIFALTMLVGSIALMNTMIMSVYERTREIGVLRAVGWRRGMVLRQVLAEGLLVTLLSGGAGLLLTEMLILAMRGMPGFLSTLFVVTPRVIAQAIGLCVALGTVGGLYPAWRATKLSPVEALRYE